MILILSSNIEIKQIKDYKPVPYSTEQINNLEHPLVGFITAKQNIHMKILEIKILEEFKEGDDEQFENDYAKLINLMIIKVIRTKGRSQTISNPIQSKNLTALDYLKEKNKITIFNRSKYADLNENISEDDEVKMKEVIRERSRLHTISNSVQNKNLKAMDVLKDKSNYAELNEMRIESNNVSKEIKKMSKENSRWQKISLMDYTNRLANYTGLKSKQIEPKNVSDDNEGKTKKIARGREKSQSQKIRSTVCNETTINSKIEPEDDKMKLQKKVGEQPQLYTPVPSPSFTILPLTNNMLNEAPMEPKEDQSEENELEMLEINIRKKSLDSRMQLNNHKK